MTNANEIRRHLAIRDARVDVEKRLLAIAEDKVKEARQAVAEAREGVNELRGRLSAAIDQEAKRAINRDRAAAKRAAKKYSITIENDSAWDIDGYDMRHYVGCPEWLNEDPLEDGHFAYDWSDTRWLVEFYAKHHPSHPKHGEREFLEISPWN